MTIQSESNAKMVKVFAPATLNEGDTFDAVVDGTVFQAAVPAGGVREGQSFQVPHPNPTTMVKVFSPSTLPEGASFDAVVDGIVFKATVPAGGVREGQSFQVPHPNQSKPQKMVKVIAPATLAEGATFDAVVDGILFQAKVPAGGVIEGQSIQVPYPEKKTKNSKKRATNSNKNEDGWRYDLFGCCSNGNILLTLMGMCCPMVLSAQMTERMGLNVAGCKRKDAADNAGSKVCQIQLGVAVILTAVMLICSVFGFAFMAGFVQMALYAWLILLFVAHVCVRKAMREHYDLPGVCCRDAGCIDDCCVSYWCGCCSVLQMASHTHDPEEYKYECCTSTGLGPDAPPCHIV